MSPLIKRVISGISANMYGQAVTILIQLASLPLFLSHWDVATYGIWLTLSAIPSYLSMADVGMVTVAGNRMTMLMSRGEQVKANTVFHSAHIFVLSSCLSIAGIALLVIYFSPIDLLSDGNIKLVLTLLIANVLINLYCGLANALFKSTLRYAMGTGIDVTARLLEWIGGIVGLLSYGTFTSVALGMLLVRVITCVIFSYLASYNHPCFSWGIKNASQDEIKEMIKPSIGFMTFPIANAITFQGFTILTAALLGPASVAIFNAYRTIARVAVQVTSVFSHALWPEFARMYGTNEFAKIKTLFFRSGYIGGISATILSFLIYFISPYLLSIWTKDSIAFDNLLISLFLCYAAIAGMWHVPRVLLMATNSHSRLGVTYLTISIFSVLIAWKLTNNELSTLALAMIAGEILISAACWIMALKLLRDIRNLDLPNRGKRVKH